MKAVSKKRMSLRHFNKREMIRFRLKAKLHMHNTQVRFKIEKQSRELQLDEK